MRVAIGGIGHESSTFTPVPTTRADFEKRTGICRNDAILQRFAGSNTPIGGFIDRALEQQDDLMPLLYTHAFPSGVASRKTYSDLKDELLEHLVKALPVDGVFLDQHGAMVVEDIDDADGDLIEAVRSIVGANCPIAVSYDLHSNHTPERIAAANLSIGFETFPHIDMAERGHEAGVLLGRTNRGEIRPRSALVSIPLFWHAPRQISGVPPWTEAIERLHELKSRPDVLTATIATGFPFADVPHRGPSVIVITDDDQELAGHYAKHLADWIWDRRQDWQAPITTVDEALKQGDGAGRYPVIIADQSDNPGNGAPGDGTEMLRTFISRGLRDSLVLYMVDPDAASRAHRAGTGRLVDIAVGGKSHPKQGPPMMMKAEVVALSEGHFRYDGPMYKGLEGNTGRSAALHQDGVTVVCITNREQPIDMAFARSLGINCAAMKYIGVKSAAHFRSGFEAIAGNIYNVDTAGVHTMDLKKLHFTKEIQPIYGGGA